MELNPEKKTTVHKDKLEEKGFNFKYHTHTYTTQKGSIYVFCYEQGFLPLEKNFYMLVAREDEKS